VRAYVSRGATRGDKWGTISMAPITKGAPKNPNNVTSTLNMLPKDLMFKHGGTKLVS